MPDKKIGEFELQTSGPMGSQYYQGFGSTSEYPEATTGNGDTIEEAINEAIESIAQMGWDTDGLRERITQEYGEVKPHQSATEAVIDAHGYTEPDPEDYEGGEEDEEYQAALEKYEDDIESLNEDADSYYYVGIRWAEQEPEETEDS